MNEGQDYAARLIEAWNRKDFEAVLALWSDDMEFCSPLAEELTGSPVLNGKAAVAAYWREALAAEPRLHFELVEAYWDPGSRAVTILYRRQRGADLRLAAELVILDKDCRGARGIALHGAALQPSSSISRGT